MHVPDHFRHDGLTIIMLLKSCIIFSPSYRCWLGNSHAISAMGGSQKLSGIDVQPPPYPRRFAAVLLSPSAAVFGVVSGGKSGPGVMCCDNWFDAPPLVQPGTQIVVVPGSQRPGHHEALRHRERIPEYPRGSVPGSA